MVIPFRGHHIAELDNWGAQQWMRTHFGDLDYSVYEQAGPAHTGVAGDHVVICAGLMRINDYRAIAWAFVADTLPQHMVAAHKAVSRFLERQPFKRVEAFVEPESQAAVRWVQMLGFQLECAEKPFFLPDGGTAAEYVRFN